MAKSVFAFAPPSLWNVLMDGIPKNMENVTLAAMAVNHWYELAVDDKRT